MRISQLFLPLLIVVALYFLFLRPQRARQRKALELSNAIAPGQRIVTTAGMYATVVSIDEDGVLLEIAPGVQVRYVRQAVSRVVDTPVGDEVDSDVPTGDDGFQPYEPASGSAQGPTGGATASGSTNRTDGARVQLAKNAPDAGIDDSTEQGSASSALR